MLTVIKAFVSGLFSGMAQDQAKRGDFEGTLARAKAALAVADEPLTRFAAHAQMAMAFNLGQKLEDMRVHKSRAILIYVHNPTIATVAEARSLRAGLDELP